MSHTIDIFIPRGKRRSELGKFLTTLKGLRASARNPVPTRPRMREHDQDIPSIRTPNEYTGAFIERYEDPCECEVCTEKRTGDAGDFKEADHPRGQPENVGEFAKTEHVGGGVFVNPNLGVLRRLLDQSVEYNGRRVLRVLGHGDNIALGNEDHVHGTINDVLKNMAHPMAVPGRNMYLDPTVKRFLVTAFNKGESTRSYAKTYPLGNSLVAVGLHTGLEAEEQSLPESEWPLGLKRMLGSRTQDAEWALEQYQYYAPVFTEVEPGTQPFEEVFQHALDFPARYRTTAAQWLPTEDAFEEGKHPRGQPENAGEFAEKAGAKKTGRLASLVQSKPDRSDFPEHIKKLVIPPAWTNVHYSADPLADLQAMGQDATKRWQPVYTAEFLKKGSQAKFGRVRELEKLFTDITAKNETNRKSKLPIIRDTADVAKLIMETGIRPGSDKDTGAKIKAYGATTLLGQHVQADASGVTLDYIGKDAVHLTIPVTDKATADMIRKRAKAAGPDGKLFPTTNAAKLQGYVKQLSSGAIKPKDFRTYVANSTALGAIRMIPAPENESAYKKSVIEVAKRVSKKLGNTPSIALASYINPVVFAEWRAKCCGA